MVNWKKMNDPDKNIINSILVITVKPVYKGHPNKRKNVVFMYKLKLYALFINGKIETALYRQWFAI
jgi:hypothetical protein